MTDWLENVGASGAHIGKCECYFGLTNKFNCLSMGSKITKVLESIIDRRYGPIIEKVNKQVHQTLQVISAACLLVF